ncbi:hypothetical protein RHGRI_021095 [Rhododendron griersonianum]|uniref:RNase H type-1 domain-containing protein n=1 Tax=Rhododendron griersonianum TaxID=479676 RepID=A0AAV6JLY6_9ERIC|nr:hypothetical protein RHGRI_021095 [Rhododendron griersonianum]
MLIINQLLDIYEVRKPELVPFNNYARRLIAWLGDVTLEHVPRGENRQADALAKLASTLALPDHETHVPICRSWVIPIFESEDNGEREVNVVSVLEIETEDWRQPFIDYLQHGKLPDEDLTHEDNARLRLEELEALDEKRLEAQQHLECYQARMSKSFNKKVRLRSFQKGDLVLAVRRPINTTHKIGGKFISKWDGPYVVQEVYSSGAYKLVAEDGLRVGPINGKFLKRYYH